MGISSTGTINVVQRVSSIQEVQDAVVQGLMEDVYFAKTKIPVLAENALDIVSSIRSALGRLGIVVVVQTPRLHCSGTAADGHPVWTIDEYQVLVTEMPTTNRGRAGASTALDTALHVAEVLHEMHLSVRDIEQTEEAGYVIVSVTATATAFFAYRRQDLPEAQAETQQQQTQQQL